jgi:hypothetical protein
VSFFSLRLYKIARFEPHASKPKSSKNRFAQPADHPMPDISLEFRPRSGRAANLIYINA